MAQYGYINSVQTLGTVDGPGIRFVAFLQGCNLRCACCHNPETWKLGDADRMSAEELVSRAEHYREYFGSKGGVTLTGGEPLLQASFAREVFKLCHDRGINTCLDTSGSIMSDEVSALLDETDYVLLDIKYTDEESYRRYVGCELAAVLDFLDVLNERNIHTVIRQVIIPTKNDTEENIEKLNEIVKSHPCVKKVELLPFKKICQVKYDREGIPFRFGELPSPRNEEIEHLRSLLVK